MNKVIIPNHYKFDPNELTLEGEIISEHQQKCLDGSIFEYLLIKTKYGTYKYIKEEIIEMIEGLKRLNQTKDE